MILASEVGFYYLCSTSEKGYRHQQRPYKQKTTQWCQYSEVTIKNNRTGSVSFCQYVHGGRLLLDFSSGSDFGVLGRIGQLQSLQAWVYCPSWPSQCNIHKFNLTFFDFIRV